MRETKKIEPSPFQNRPLNFFPLPKKIVKIDRIHEMERHEDED